MFLFVFVFCSGIVAAIEMRVYDEFGTTSGADPKQAPPASDILADGTMQDGTEALPAAFLEDQVENEGEQKPEDVAEDWSRHFADEQEGDVEFFYASFSGSSKLQECIVARRRECTSDHCPSGSCMLYVLSTGNKMSRPSCGQYCHFLVSRAFLAV